MKSFDEFFSESFDIDEYNYRECQVHNHGFYLGEQSKQAEVDELRKRIDEVIYDLQHIESAMWEEQVDHVLMVLKGDQS